VTALGLIVILLTLSAIARPSVVPYLMAATMPLVSSSALEFAGNKVQPFFIAAIAPTVLLILRPRERSSRLGGLPVTAVAYCAMTAVLLPVVFAGRDVLIPRGGIDEQVADPGTLAPSLSNLAQAGYLGLAVLVIIYFAKNPPKDPGFLAFGFGVGTVLNLWALLGQVAGVFYPADVFRPTIYGVQSENVVNGVQRFSGIYSEPSMMATFAITGAIYGLLAMLSGGHHKGIAAALLVGNVVMLVMSYSGTAVIGGAIVGALSVGVFVWKFGTGQLKVAPSRMVLLLIGLVALVIASNVVFDYALQLLTNKLASSSYTNRSGSNSFSWDMFLDTWFVGVGLGASRPSSFALMLLSNVGLIGTGLLVGLAGRIVLRVRRISAVQPEVWAFVAVLVVKVVAEPNLSNPIPWMLLAACAAAYNTAATRDVAAAQVGAETGGGE
jgi:hypothetical protein